MLKEVAEALNSASTEQQAAREALRRMADLLGVATGWVWLRDPASGRFYSAAVQSLPPAAISWLMSFEHANCPTIRRSLVR